MPGGLAGDWHEVYRQAVVKQARTGYNPIKDFCGKPQKSLIGGAVHGI